MKTLHLAFALLIFAAVAAPAEIPAGWSSEYRETLARAKTNREPVLIFFTASWCAPCKRMARTTLTNKTVVAALKAIPHLALDIDEQPILAEQHAIQAVPTFQIVLPSAKPVVSLTGFREPAELVDWIKAGTEVARKTAVRQAELAVKLTRAEELLQSADSLSRSNGVAGLLDLVNEGTDGIGEKLTARLNSLPAQDVPWLLPGLAHASLAVRIQAANLLRARVGDTFDIDPWSDEATRRTQVDQWRTRLPTLTIK